MRSMKMHSSSSSTSSKEVPLPAPQKQKQLSALPISAGQRLSGPSLARSGGTTAPAWRGVCRRKDLRKEKGNEEPKLSNERETRKNKFL